MFSELKTLPISRSNTGDAVGGGAKSRGVAMSFANINIAVRVSKMNAYNIYFFASKELVLGQNSLPVFNVYR